MNTLIAGETEPAIEIGNVASTEEINAQRCAGNSRHFSLGGRCKKLKRKHDVT